MSGKGTIIGFLFGANYLHAYCLVAKLECGGVYRRNVYTIEMDERKINVWISLFEMSLSFI
jgi:hypothetical protein